MPTSAPSGYLCIFLNAHVPYVAPTPANAKYTYEWLCASIAESYLPLMQVCERLAAEEIPYHLNLGISPSLLEMLKSSLIDNQLTDYFIKRQEYNRREEERLAYEPELLALARRYSARTAYLADLFHNHYRGRLIPTLERLIAAGHIEILAATATGTYLPLLEPVSDLAWGQIQVGCQNYKKYFSTPPQGLWSFSGGYTPELDELIRRAGLKYTLVRSLSLLGATPRPQTATYRPVRTPGGLTVFATDIEAMLDIFQNRSGYAYSPEYLNITTLTSQSIASKNNSLNGEEEKEWGIPVSYYSRQRRGEEQQIYNPELAASTAKSQAQTFVENRLRQVRWLSAQIGKPPVIAISIRAEIFGQGWYEGAIWLEEVLRLLAKQQTNLQSATFSSLADDPDYQVCTPNSGSSNRGSFNANWLDESNSWIYKHAFLAGKRMLKMAKIGHQGDSFRQRLINQAARELLLAQCSDWSTLIASGFDSRWARKTVRRHLVSFHKLFDDFREGRVDEEGLRKLEDRCPIFPQLDYQACYKDLERSTPTVSSPAPDQNAPAITVNKDEVIAGIVQIQNVTRELAVLCQQALASDKDVSIDISTKACESVAIVEDLAKRAHDPNALQNYLKTTTVLENIIKIIADTNDNNELLNLHREAIDAVDAWAETVENLLKSIMAQAN